jgi:hypothetical protein
MHRRPSQASLFSLTKRVGHTLMWVAARSNEESLPGSLKEPSPGFCSDLELLPEKGLEPTPLHAVLLHLARYECYRSLGKSQFERFRHDLRKSPLAFVRWMCAELCLTHAMRDADASSCISAVLDEAEAQTLLERSPRPTEPIHDDQVKELSQKATLVLHVKLLSVVTLLMARGISVGSLHDEWLNHSLGRAGEVEVRRFLEAFRRLTGPLSSRELSRCAGEDPMVDSIVALSLSVSEDVSPEMLLQANCRLLPLLRSSQLDVIGDAFAFIISKAWHAQTERAHLLVTPRVSVPALELALGSHLSGWAKVRQILLAAIDATTWCVPRAEYERIAALPAE